jgi:DNA polymerase-3 subunit gamma/tau
MIDEVHMLTGHAFNAMLKTLEEPPPHVKFILATTDPQKIPVTVLSRCLQFNLKQMPPDAIVGHLRQVLGDEQLAFEVPALRLLAQAASGSMRDALSLTDQAIAYSAGNLTEDAVRGMLGTIDQRHLVRLLDSLAVGDARAVLAVADELATRGLSYGGALADLAALLSRVAIEQRVAGATPSEDPLAADIARLAQGLHPDAVQLFYSVAVHSRGELALAPDEYAGFVMACLRMLSLSGDAGPQTLPATPPASVASTAPTAATAAAATSGAETATPASARPGAPDIAARAHSTATTPTGPGGADPAPAGSATPDSAVPRVSATSAASPGPALASGAAALAVTPPAALSVPAATPSAKAAQPPASGATQPPPGVAQPSGGMGQPSSRAGQSPASMAQPTAGAARGVTKAEPAPASVAPWDDAPSPTAGAATATAAATATGTAAPAAASARHAGAEGEASASVRRSAPVARPDSAVAAPMGEATAAPAASPIAAPATPSASAVPQAADADAPPAWVDEVIPDDAEGGYQPSPAGENFDDGFIASPDDDDFETVAPVRPAEPAPAPVRRASSARAASRRGSRVGDMSAATWPELAARLPVTGLAAELARQSEWLGCQGDTVSLRVAVKTLADSASRVRLQTVLCEHFGLSLRLDVQVGATGDATAHAVAQQVRAERQRAAEQAAQEDPFVRSLLADFGGQIVPGSIRHVDPPAATP